MRKLLILGPSYRRKVSKEVLPALERYDGVFFRVAKKYLPSSKNVDLLIMTDDLVLVDPSTPLSYQPPRGSRWVELNLPKEIVVKARKENQKILSKILRTYNYSEIFIAMGRRFAEALPDLRQYDVKVIFPAGGLGPKAQALKKWITESKT